MWKPGDILHIDGLPFRVVEGRKKDRWPGDMRIEWMTPDGRWRAISMAASFMLANFHYVVEDGLYPPPAAGGEYFVRNVTEAARGDWRVVSERLAEQRRRRESTKPTSSPGPVVGVFTTAPCSSPSSDQSESCQRPAGHVGPHKSDSWVWPQDKAS